MISSKTMLGPAASVRRLRSLGELPVVEQSHPAVTWLVLIGAFFPSISITLGGLTLLPGRATVILLLVPALVALFRHGRSRIASDYFAFAVASWMIGSSTLNDGFRPYVLAESLEFIGAYAIGRAFFFGRPALETFVRVFKFVTFIVIALALLDTLSGRNITQEAMGIRASRPPWLLANDYRLGLIRASSTFEGFELYGTFCVAAAAIFLYSERKWLRRSLWVGFAVLGALLSLSSGPILGLGITFSAYSYGRILKHYSWRWQALVAASAALVVAAFVFSDNPVGWMVRHLTLDPQTGYWRIAEWGHATSELSNSPWIGFGLTDWKGRSRDFMIFVGEQGVDCVWLVEALRYGYPVVILFFLTIFAGLRTPNGASTQDPYMANMRTGLSSVIVIMSLIGLTVHFWNSDWIFLSLCMGIRASFAEIHLKSESATRVKLRAPRPKFG